MKQFSSPSERRSMRAWLLFVGPALGITLIFCVYPLLRMIWLSLFKYNLASGIPKSFVGLKNYSEMLGNFEFVNSIGVTLQFTFWSVAGTMVLGVALALLLNSQGVMIKILRSVALLPYMICGVALAVAWQLLYNPTFGLLDILLEFLGLPPVNWLGDIRLALYSIIVIETWQFTPFVMILVLAGLQGISPDFYEAASIDGASKLQMLTKITLPLLKNVLLSVLVLRLIDCFKSFEKVRILTVGGPLNSTDLISHYVYRTSFVRWEIGYGASGAFIVTIITGALTLLVLRLTNTGED